MANILASASYPPMPQNLSARIDAAISHEAQQRLAAGPATEPGRRDLPAHRPRAPGWSSLRIPALRSSPGRPGRPTWLAATVAAVVIATAGSYLIAEDAGTGVSHPPSSPLAGAVAPAQHVSPGPYVTYGQPASLDTIRAVQSHTNFVAARLRAQAISALNAADALDKFAPQPWPRTSTRLTASAAGLAASGGPSPIQLAGCVRLIAPGRTVLLVDIARYQGKPAAVIVTGATVVSPAEAWVVGSSCSATTKDVLAEAALGNS